MLRLALIFGAIVVAFDVVAASVARAASINYGHFELLAVVLYAAFGIFAGQRLRWPRAVAAIAIAAAIDVFAGSYVASLIGAWISPWNQGDAMVATLLTGLLNVVVGAAGVAVGSRVVRRAQ